MKTFRLIVTILLVIIFAGFSSCDKTIIVEEPVTIFPDGSGKSELEKIYSKHIEDYENMTHTSFSVYGNDSVKFTGLTAKGYLMIDLFQKSSETKVFEWIGNSKIDTTYRVHKGYGEYEEVKIHSIDIPHIQFYNKLSKDFFAMIHLSGKELLKRALFVKGTHSKITDCFPNGMSTLILNWYNNEYCFIHDCCYTLAGDTVYTIKYGEYDYNIDQYGSRIAMNGYGSFQYQFERVSAEEAVGIGIDTDIFNSYYQLRIARINYKTAQNIWGKEQYVKLPFEYEAKAKLSSSIIQKSSEIWTYNIDIVYYDGTEKKAIINVNIKNGSIIEEEIPVTLANLEGTWDMVKCYGWEYNDNYEKEDWEEDVTGEYIFFEDEDGNGGYNDGYKTYYFASSVEGNKLVLRNSEWLSGKEVTITKLTKNELYLKATDSVSEENYEMKRR